MKKKWKITILVLTVFITVVGVATYLLTIGPLGEPLLATVNGEKIPVARFQEELDRVDPAARDLVQADPGKLLEMIINRTLLLQAAKREGVSVPKGKDAVASKSREDEETATIIAYLDKEMAGLPPVAAQEIDQIYEAYKGQMGGRQKEELLPLIRQMIEQRRQGEEVERLITALRKNARVDISQTELRKLAVVTPGMETQSEADFRKALTGGKPLIVDFGSNTCIPCRELRPVLQKIRRDYAGKLEVLIIDVRNHRKLASEYQVQVIPTVIFFDARGKEMFRRQGFMSEEKVKEAIAKMGVS